MPRIITLTTDFGLADEYVGVMKGVMLAKIRLKNKTIVGIQGAYAHKAPGEILAIIGSQGFLEIAVNQGDAAMVFDTGVDDVVTVEVHRT